MGNDDCNVTEREVWKLSEGKTFRTRICIDTDIFWARDTDVAVF